MCQRCEKFDTQLAASLKAHEESGCKAKDCPIPTTDVCESVFYHLARAHSRIAEVIDRIKKTADVVERPDDVPAQLLRDWEQHVIDAAEILGRARHRREFTEGDARVRAYTETVTSKARPS